MVNRYLKSQPYGEFPIWTDREFAAVERVVNEINTRLKVKSDTGTTYTITLDDEDYVIQHTNASAIAVTVPTNANAPFEIGAAIHPAQWGAGQVTVAGDTGVTVRTASTLKTRAQYSMCSLVKVGTNEWVWFGDMA